MSRNEFAGILNVKKARGMTSRRVVDGVRRVTGRGKVGHAGTLDPLASGVLLVAVGPATRLISYLQQRVKRYRATFWLGVTSVTDDVESELVACGAGRARAREAVEEALDGFKGRQLQRPPTYSAVHVGGRRAYELARAGRAATPEAKWVEIHELRMIDYVCGAVAAESAPGVVARLVVEMACSSGTYVRSLARDLGARLGCGAVMAELTRTAIGEFTLEQSVGLEALSRETWRDHLQPAARAVRHLPQVVLPECDLRRVQRGQAVELCSEGVPGVLGDGDEVAMLNERCELVAIGVYAASTDEIWPRCVVGTSGA